MDRQGSQSGQTIVIGGGVVGLSIAVTLQQRGVSVLVLDAAVPGMGASWGNAGYIATEQVYPIADASMLPKLPAMLRDPLGPLRIDWRYLPRLAPWCWRALLNMLPANARRSHRALSSINARSLDAWLRLARSLGFGELIRVDGTLQSCETDSTERWLRALGPCATAGIRSTPFKTRGETAFVSPGWQCRCAGRTRAGFCPLCLGRTRTQTLKKKGGVTWKRRK